MNTVSQIMLRVALCATVLMPLSGCGGCRNNDNAAAVTSIELRQEWFPFSGYAGEVAAARHFAGEEGIQLKIVPGSESVDPIKVVLSGSADYGVVGGDLLISAVAKGAPLVAIGTINDQSPTCFIVRDESEIHRPADFIGHKVGILAGTNTERVYGIMMQKADVDRKKVTEIQVPFDLQTFLLGQYDVRPAFIYDEPVTLELKEVKHRIIAPKDFGVRFVGTVYFTRREIVESRKDEVQRLVNSLVKGWKHAVEQPESAIDDLLKVYPELDRERELRSLKLGKPYFAGVDNEPLLGSAESWKQTIQGLEALGEIKAGSVKIEDVWNDSFARAANGK